VKVIICGAGLVGTGIARQLAAERNDVTLIDNNDQIIQQVEETMDVRGVVGHASHPDTLQRAGAADADMLIAVTYSDEVNMIATQVAHSLFSVPRKIARVRAQSYLQPIWMNMFSRDHMPIDVIISPEIEVGRAVLRRLRIPGAFETIDFADGLVQVVGVRIAKGSAVAGAPIGQLRQLFDQHSFVVIAISRGDAFFVPSENDQMDADDDVYFVARQEEVERTLLLFGHEEHEARRVVIVGGGNIGVYTASELEQRQSRTKVKLIEYSKAHAEAAADQLDRTVVLVGSGLNQTILREAGVGEAETLVAVTDVDEVNILASLMAKKMGVQRTITLINNQDYTGLLQSLDIGAYLDPRATTVSTILQHVRRGRIKMLHSIRNGAGEVIEAEALETSPLVGRPLRDAKLPSGIVLGAILRDGEIHTPAPEFEIVAGDRIVLFAQRDMVRKVEQLFRVSLEYF
jgi:trk system potassium uptake protein TrkA